MSLLDRFPLEFVKKGAHGSYIEHSQIRQRLIRAQEDGLLRWEWKVLELIAVEGEFVVHGSLMVSRPHLADGKQVWVGQTHEVIGDPWANPAAAESRAFTRAVAFCTGIGLQAWTGEASYWLDRPPAS